MLLLLLLLLCRFRIVYYIWWQRPSTLSLFMSSINHLLPLSPLLAHNPPPSPALSPNATQHSQCALSALQSCNIIPVSMSSRRLPTQPNPNAMMSQRNQNRDSSLRIRRFILLWRPPLTTVTTPHKTLGNFSSHGQFPYYYSFKDPKIRFDWVLKFILSHLSSRIMMNLFSSSSWFGSVSSH